MADPEEQIASVMAITGCGAKEASAGLEASDWEMEAAVNLLLAAGPGYGAGSPEPPAQAQPQNQPPLGEDYIRPAMEMGGGAQRLIGGNDDDDDIGYEGMQDLAEFPGMQMGMGMAGFGMPGGNIPAMAELLRATRSNGRAAGAPDFAFSGSLDEAREKGRTEGRWLIVNLIMPHSDAKEENKAIWEEDVTSAVVQSGFVFWQDFPNSAEADRLLRNHGFTHPEYPLSIIIDPRTGEKVENWSGALSPEEVQARLHPYAANPLAPPSEPSSPLMGGGSQQHSPLDLGEGVGAGEDRALQEAIAASMGGGDRQEQAGNNDIDDEEEAMRRAIAASLEDEPATGPVPDAGEIPPSAGPSGLPQAPSPVDAPAPTPDSEWRPTVDLDRYFSEEKGEGLCTFRIQLTDSSLHTKHVRKDCPTIGIFEWVKSEVEEARGREFDLKFGFPPRPLSSSTSVTAEAAKLAGEKLTMVWA